MTRASHPGWEQTPVPSRRPRSCEVYPLSTSHLFLRNINFSVPRSSLSPSGRAPLGRVCVGRGDLCSFCVAPLPSSDSPAQGCQRLEQPSCLRGWGWGAPRRTPPCVWAFPPSAPSARFQQGIGCPNADQDGSLVVLAVWALRKLSLTTEMAGLRCPLSRATGTPRELVTCYFWEGL